VSWYPNLSPDKGALPFPPGGDPAFFSPATMYVQPPLLYALVTPHSPGPTHTLDPPAQLSLSRGSFLPYIVVTQLHHHHYHHRKHHLWDNLQHAVERLAVLLSPVKYVNSHCCNFCPVKSEST
jgi:hypothetical protein